MEVFALPDVSDSDDAEVISSHPSQVCFMATSPFYLSNPVMRQRPEPTISAECLRAAVTSVANPQVAIDSDVEHLHVVRRVHLCYHPLRPLILISLC